MRVGEVFHLTHDDLILDGPTPVAHIRAKDVVPGEKPWRPKNGEERAVPLSPRAVAMLRTLPRRRRWATPGPWLCCSDPGGSFSCAGGRQGAVERLHTRRGQLVGGQGL